MDEYQDEDRRREIYERVHTVSSWWDGPRKGLADLGGVPHLFVSTWGIGDRTDSDRFLLSPVDRVTFERLMEEWEIWRRWETEYQGRRLGWDSRLALPEDRARYGELQELLAHSRLVDAPRAIQAEGWFRFRSDPEWNRLGSPPMEVCWMQVSRRDDAARDVTREGDPM